MLGSSLLGKMLFVRERIIWFCSYLDKCSGLSSSHRYFRVCRDACLICIYSFPEFVQRLGMRSSHSCLGISILAMALMATATWLRTTEEGVARL